MDGITRMNGMALLLLVALVVLGVVAAIAWMASRQKMRFLVKGVVALLIVAAVVAVGWYGTMVPMSVYRQHQARQREADQAATQAETPPTVGSALLNPAIELPSPAEDSATETESEDDPTETVPKPTAEAPVAAAAGPTPPEDRPDWVDAPPGKTDGVYRMAVAVGPYVDEPDLDKGPLPDEIGKAVDKYIAMYQPEAHRLVDLPDSDVRKSIMRGRWAESREFVISPEGQVPEEHETMTEVHVLLEFDREANALIEDEWENVVVARRITAAGAVSAGVLLLLTGVWGYLKIDVATKGAYRGRLRLAAFGVIVLVVALGFHLVRHEQRVRVGQPEVYNTPEVHNTTY
ncbi:MAG: hypothetical protein ACYTG0_05595 [Planctomycetota bacterium]|jgi:hypothetical protein